MTDGRIRTAGALALSGLFILGSTAPASAAPSWEQANERADQLDTVADRLTAGQERLSSQLARSHHQLDQVERGLDRARAARRAAQRELVDLLLDDARSSSGALAADVLPTDRPVDIALVSQSDADLVRTSTRADRTVDRLQGRQEELQQQILRLDTFRDADRPKTLRAQRQADQAQAMVDRMRQVRISRAQDRAEAAEAAEAAEQSEEAPAAAPASSGGAAAVAYALAQVGDAYVWGAAGPDAFDCSGLTMAAWAQAGVSLPHQSSAQMSSGTPVSTSALQPGDLVFYYSPVSHIGMYVGNGQIVHAGNPSTGVRVDPLNSMPLVGAVRPG